MIQKSVARRLVLSLVPAVFLFLACPAFSQKHTALDRYVAQPDPAYHFELQKTMSLEGCTISQIKMVSQVWRTPQEVDRPRWDHWLNVIRPGQVKGKTAMLFIAGGSNGEAAPRNPDRMLLKIARESGIVVAELREIPNQPLTFAGEVPMKEDGIIAYTWDKFLRTGDETWPARLPMTKAAVRAMDTVTSFCRTAPGGSLEVEKFIVSGGSKRGWTAWTTAAVDRRVTAIIPCVIDLLNLTRSFQHHFQAYGFWAPAVGDYVKLGLMEQMDHPRWKKLMKIVEPYEYRDRLTMPKYLINAAGDQFFLPDSSQFYFDDLKGEKYLRYVPNADHSLRGSDAPESILSFVQTVVDGAPRPAFRWKFSKDGSIRVQCATAPREVRLWQATNPKARDFRLETLGAAWKSSVLSDQGEGAYVGSVPKPPGGWTAYFVEMTFPGSGKAPLKFTTGVRVHPDTLPFSKPVMAGKKSSTGSSPAKRP